MAATALADVSAALSLMLRPKITNQINNVAVLPYLLPIVKGEGKSLNWTVKFSGATDAVASAEGAARSSSDADDEIPVSATLNWATYDKTSSVTDLAQAAAGSNFNPESIQAIGRDLLLGLVTDQTARIAKGIARDMYEGDPAGSPIELAGAALAIDSSGTFAGINPATYTEWASVENTAALAALSFALIQDFLTDVYDNCGFYPEFVTVPSNVFNAIKGLYTDYEAHTIREINLSSGGGARGDEPRAVKLSAGMRAVEVDQVPFVLDRHCTANTMYAFHSDFVRIHQLDPMQSILDGGAEAINDLFSRLAGRVIQLPRADIEGMMAKNNGLRPHIKLLGDRGLSKEAVTAVFAQVEWRRRNAFGKFTWT